MAIGIPITSVQDLIFLKEYEKQNDVGYQALSGLAQGVAKGIEKKREEAEAKKKQEESFANAIKLKDSIMNNTNAGKIKTTIDKDGGLSFTFESGSEAETDKDLLGLQKDVAKLGYNIPKTKEDALRLIARGSQKQQFANARKTNLTQKRLDFYNEQELRRTADNKLSSGFPLKIDTSDEGKNEVDNYIMDSYGLDVNDAMTLGIAKRNLDGTLTLAPTKERDRVISERTVPEEAGKSIVEFKDTKDILTDSLNEYKALKLNVTNKDKGLIDKLFNPTGPFSPVARSNLLRQFGDPRVAALFDKLERAFQKYRIKTTGVQASDQELQKLRPLIANFLQTPEVFEENMQDIIRELDQSVSNRISTLKSYNRDENVINSLEKMYYTQPQMSYGSPDIKSSLYKKYNLE